MMNIKSFKKIKSDQSMKKKYEYVLVLQKWPLTKWAQNLDIGIVSPNRHNVYLGLAGSKRVSPKD